jgi:cytoskeletal protein CcmA (bactofilin family)
MWRKPDAKPSSDSSNGPSSMPPRTQPQSTFPPQQPSFERPAAAPAPVSHGVSDSAAPDSSRIGAGLKIRGEITGNSDLYLDGEANGKIRINGARVTIGPKGKVQADIDAKEIVVNGSVQGSLKADAKLRLGASSQVDGSLAAPSIGIEDGARFHGKVEVTRSKPAPAVSEPEPANDAELKPVAAHAEDE